MLDDSVLHSMLVFQVVNLHSKPREVIRVSDRSKDMSNNDFTRKARDDFLRGWLPHYFHNSTSRTVDHTERVEARLVGVHLWWV